MQLPGPHLTQQHCHDEVEKVQVYEAVLTQLVPARARVRVRVRARVRARIRARVRDRVKILQSMPPLLTPFLM